MRWCCRFHFRYVKNNILLTLQVYFTKSIGHQFIWTFVNISCGIRQSKWVKRFEAGKWSICWGKQELARTCREKPKRSKISRGWVSVRACSHGSGAPRQGEVPHLPVVKKYLSSLATLGTRGEVQNAITWSLSMHINKELLFVPGEDAFRFNVVVGAKL